MSSSCPCCGRYYDDEDEYDGSGLDEFHPDTTHNPDSSASSPETDAA